MCILNKRHKNKKKVVEEVDFTNKEVEEDDKEEEGAERARGKCNTFFFCFVSFRHSSSSWKNSLRLSALSLSLARSHPARRSVFRGFRWPPVDGIEVVVVVGATPRAVSLILALVLSRVSVFLARAR